MSSILFTDAGGTWKLTNGKPWPASRFANWTPDSAPFGDSAHRVSDGLMTMFRLRDDYGVSFELPLIPSNRSNNEALRSEELDHAVWAKVAATVTANAVAGPDGIVTADKIEETTATNSHGVVQDSPVVLSNNAAYSLGVSAKAAERSWLLLILADKSGSSHGQFYNLSTGTKGSAYGAAQVNSDIFYQGNSWWRAWIAANVGVGGTTPQFVVYASTGDTITSYTGVAGSGIYATRVMVDAYTGSAPGPYLLTSAATVEGVAQVDIADRLRYHLLAGGTCAVYPNDVGTSSYVTCGLRPGTTPGLQLTDRRTMEFTLQLSLLNVAVSPTRMVARYAES